MTQLVLKGNIEKKKLDSLLLFLRSWDIDAEIKTATQKEKKYEPFTESFGMWKNYDIDAKTIREQAWKTKERFRTDFSDRITFPKSFCKIKNSINKKENLIS